MPIDPNKLFKAAALVILLGVILLSLTYILPVLGVLVALAIVAAAIYLVYLVLTGKIKI